MEQENPRPTHLGDFTGVGDLDLEGDLETDRLSADLLKTKQPF